MDNTKRYSRLILVLLALMLIDTSLFAYTSTTGTGILKEVALGQMSGEVGFLIVMLGVVLAGITLIVSKSLPTTAIVFFGVILIAMSTDISSGLITQFANKL